MNFLSAKGLLVVDPIEIDNRVYRTQDTNFKAPGLPRWSENSQCRFDIDPEVCPLLKIYLLEKTSGLPSVIGKAEVNLIDIFYEKKTDRWVKLSSMGQLNIEFTFYQATPMLPRKETTVPPQVPQKPTPNTEGDIKKEKVTQKVSSADKVFEEEKEEKNRLRELAKRVKRRYRSSRSTREFAIKEQSNKMTNDELLYVEVNQKIEKVEKELPTTPTDESSGSGQIDETIPDVSILKFDNESMSQIDLSTLPFSADSIGTHAINKVDVFKAEQAKLREEEAKMSYVPLSTEVFAAISRLERGSPRPSDFKIEGGASRYNGDGTWAIGRLTDAAYTGDTPKLPPKIPYGMKSEEYYMLHRSDYIDHFKAIL